MSSFGFSLLAVLTAQGTITSCVAGKHKPFPRSVIIDPSGMRSTGFSDSANIVSSILFEDDPQRVLSGNITTTEKV